MAAFPWSTKAKTSVHPLDNSGYLLDVNGHKVLALRLSGKVAMEIAGDSSIAQEGLLSKLKGKISQASESEQWLAVTSIENPLLEDYNNFGALIAQGLTEASGITVGKSDLAIAGSIRI